jgi:hypothetical protein
LSNVIFYGTDGEKALSDALAKAFRKLPSLPMDGRTLPNGKIMHECQCLHSDKRHIITNSHIKGIYRGKSLHVPFNTYRRDY